MYQNWKCKILGHKWKYNFPTLPNKEICERCKIKAALNTKTLEWNPIENFPNEKRSDETLIKDWV